MDAVLLVILLTSIATVLWVFLAGPSRQPGGLLGRRLLMAAAISAVFSPGLLVGGHGAIPAPAVVCLIAGGEVYLTSFAVVFLIFFVLFLVLGKSDDGHEDGL